MTDTGQVPGEGQPESAGMVEQPGVPAHGAYTYLSEAPAEDEELLLPGAQGAWGNEVPPPAPEPVVEAVHEPGPHETSGRDSGSVDLGGVRLPNPAPASVPPSPILSAPQEAPAAAQPPRRPLHLGPPIPDTSASPVRSLADRGPAGAPVRQTGPATTGPEYLDAQPLREAAPQSAAPWGAVPEAGPGTAPAAVAQAVAQAPAAETVDPAAAPADGAPAESVDPSGAAQAAVARLATQAAAQVPAPAQVVHGHDGPQPAHGHDGVYTPPAGQGPENTHQQPPSAGTPAEGTESVQAAAQPAEGAQSAQVFAVAPQGGEPVPVAVASGEAAGPVPVQEAGSAGEQAVPAPVQETGVQEAPGEAVSAQMPADVQIAPGVEGDASGRTGEGVPIAGEAQVAAGPEAVGTAPAEGEPEAVVPAQPAAVPAEPAPAGEAPLAAEAVPANEAVAAHEAVPAHEAAPPAPEPLVAPEPVAAVPVPEAAAAEAGEAPVPPAPDLHQVQGPQLTHPAVHDAELAPALPQHEQPVQPQPSAQDAAQQAVPAAEPAPESDLGVPAGPQTQPAEAAPAPAATDVAETPDDGAPAPVGAEGDGAPDSAVSGEPLPTSVPYAPHPEQPLGQFVPVEGQVPTPPHLAPTPPQPLVLPAQDDQGPQDPQGAQQPQSPQDAVATVPSPREAEPATASAAQDGEHTHDVVQHAEDLRTRAADQEESTAPVAEARQPAGPAAPGYDDAEREAVLKVMRERRDIRNGFRDDPIPHEVLLRVLEAAHTAPSVGHSQPWDFVVIRSAETRRAMHELAMRQREAYAKSLPKGRAKQFKELKIEAILDTPVNIVVTADPTRGGRHTLGRHTQPQMAPYSAALAVENLWLAARAEGLGVGWVSFFDEREMVRALGLPEHLEVIAYLCVGYVDEFPDEPELMQAGWSKRRPLSWVVHEETYGRRALPGEEPHDLLAETVAQIRPLDAKALGEAWERQKRMTKPAGALGMLEIISAQLSGLSRQCPPPIPEPAAVAIFAGDHGVHAQGVTPWPQEVTAQMVANFLGGGAVCNAFANQVGAEVCVVDVGVAADLPATPGLLPRKIRGGTSDMTTGPAMTREEAKAAIEVGIETARDLVAAGNKALLTGEMGIANTTASAALISVFTGADPAEVTGRGTGINDETLARKTDVVRRALEFHQPDPADPIGVLAAIGGFEHAAMVGLLLGGASLRTPVILDGVSAGAAALVARAIAPEVLAACIAGHRSAEPGHVAALNKLGLRPLVDLDLRLGEGTGALLALPLVQSTARAMHEVATFDSAGVTEK
jgi:nicotinate-nucleotide--dimethylbenzimidazole phosphoribosyltransferase